MYTYLIPFMYDSSTTSFYFGYGITLPYQSLLHAFYTPHSLCRYPPIIAMYYIVHLHSQTIKSSTLLLKLANHRNSVHSNAF